MTTINNIPGVEECYDLMKQYGMLQNILDHSVQVMRVSLAITDNLIDPALVDRELITASSLLHDIAKTRTIQTGELRHDRIGGDMLRDLGWDSVAAIVESHVFFDKFLPDGIIEEREIVYYADKRVMHDRIVTIDERIEDLVVRYGKSEKIKTMIIENKKFIKTLESKISEFLKTDIESVINSV